jgi:hypothetical protein
MEMWREQAPRGREKDVRHPDFEVSGSESPRKISARSPATNPLEVRSGLISARFAGTCLAVVDKKTDMVTAAEALFELGLLPRRGRI